MTRRAYNGADPVFGIDIDGTLGKYHEHFLRFARLWLGIGPDAYWPGPFPTRGHRTRDGGPLPWEDDGYDGSCPLNEYMGVAKATYRKVKLAYRQGGMKRSMPMYPGADWLCDGLRRAGGWVVLCTTRPYLHLSNVEPDTTEWLRRNGIKYDDIIMGENKYRSLKKNYGRNVVAVLDDDPALLSQATEAGLRALLMSRHHNSEFTCRNDWMWNDENWWVASCADALTELKNAMKEHQG